ncbi:MAG: prolyl oligopeptidase family serine peptidase [Candidatus Zixiibacteriota bacterium]
MLHSFRVRNSSGLRMLILIFVFLPSSLFAQDDFLPTIEDTLCPTDWLYAGPFSIGAREGIVGVIEDLENLRPREGEKLRSILPQGGEVTWKKIAPDSLYWVKLEYENVQWDTLMDYYGVAGILDAGYAYTEFGNIGRKRALVIAERVGSFYLNGKRFWGDPYAHGFVKTPVVLEDGVNRILVPLSGYGDHRFMFRLVPAPNPVMLITKDATLPDIIEGKEERLWAGVAVLNTTSKRLKDVKVSVGGGEYFEESEVIVPSLLSLCVKKMPVPIEIAEFPGGVDTISVAVKVSYGNFVSQDRLVLRIREEGESYRATFISKIDQSCQYYALLPPKDYDPQEKYALILSLHGAGVEASGLVDSYSQKDWAFVVAPTNRRKFGFDWQDWGRLDALEVLEQVKETSSIDTNKVYITGHSMGGHGTWHIALAHSDLFAAAAPLAGWTSFQLYIPWFLQKSYTFAEPAQLAIRDMSLREDFVPNFVENALNLPIFISQGGNDDNVPPVHSRLFASLLERLGYEYRYKEIPEKGHWYSLDDPDKTVCVDDPELVEFLKSRERDLWPKCVIFKTTNLGQNHKSYWVEIIRQEKPFFESRIEVEVKEGRIEVSARNVREFALHLSQNLLPLGKIVFSVNGQEIGYQLRKSEEVSFYKKGDEFRIGRTKHRRLRKSPESYGPIKQAYFSPFVLVYGTKGDSVTTATTLHQARLEATRWWRRANGFAEVLPDTEVTSETMENFNLILFGGPEENLVTVKLNRKLPIRIEGQKIILGKKEIVGDGLAAKFIYPNPLNPERFICVHEGVSLDGLKLSTFFTALYSGAGLPDFIIFDEEVKFKGWGGVICAGFFDPEWQLDERLFYLQE